MEADIEEPRQKIAIGLEAAECGEVAPLDIEATIAFGNRRLAAEAHLDALLREGLDGGFSVLMTAQDWDDIRVKMQVPTSVGEAVVNR